MPRQITYTTLLGLQIELRLTGELERYHDKIAAAEGGAAAEAMAYGTDPAVKHPLTPIARNMDGLPSWSALTLQSPEWAYLQDAVALCRARHGELDVGSVLRSATWTVAEAARSLGVNEDAVRVAVRSGQLPAVQAEGRYLLNRRTVEAHETTGTRAGRTERVPALYVRAGTVGEAALIVHAVDAQGAPVDGELLGSVDGVDERVFEGWARAVIHWGRAGQARAVIVRPAHGRAATKYAIDSLGAVGRFELEDKTNNRGEAAAMLDAFKAEIRRPRRG